MQQTLTVDLVENPVQYHKDIFVKYHLRKKCNQQEISKFLIEYFIEYLVLLNNVGPSFI